MSKCKHKNVETIVEMLSGRCLQCGLVHWDTIWFNEKKSKKYIIYIKMLRDESLQDKIKKAENELEKKIRRYEKDWLRENEKHIKEDFNGKIYNGERI